MVFSSWQIKREEWEMLDATTFAKTKTRTINVEALLELKRVLRHVQKEDLRFDISRWHSGGRLLPRIVAEWCGTAACAAGWAARDDWFKKRGFGRGLYGARGFVECDRFFGRPASNIFNHHFYPYAATPEMVIEKIDELISTNG
jgi:hypothetical protein